MTAFAVLSVLLVAAVVAFILWPIWQGTRQGGPARVRITTAGWIALACTPALIAVIYVSTGSPGTAPGTAPKAGESAAGHTTPGQSPPQVAANAELLAARVRKNPEDAQGWALLGRSLAALGRFREAADALGEAARRQPGNASVLADRADVLAMAQGRNFAGEPDLLIQAALEADPRQLKALVLAGSSAFGRGDFATAAVYWRRYLAIVPPGDPLAREVDERVREAERRAGAAATRTLTGTVAFAAGEGLRLEPGDVVFVTAKPRDGQGRPIAAARLPVSTLPVAFRLDDGNSLLATSPLSSFAEVVLEARLSRGGGAEPRPGDPRSQPRAVKPGERAIALEMRLPRG